MEHKFSHNDYEIVEREDLYTGFFRLARYHIRQRLFNGGWSDIYDREIFERNSAAAVLPYDPKLNHVVLIEQFRPGAISDPKSPWLIEIPAGIMMGQVSEEDVAKHEADEEAGCKILELEYITEYFVSPGGTNEYITLFCGKTDASKVEGIHGLKQENEDIRVINISLDEALKKLAVGEIKSSPAIISLMWLERNKNYLITKWK